MKKALKELAAVIAATCVSLWPVLALAQETSRRGGGIKYTSAGGGTSSGISGSLGATDNVIPRAHGTGGATLQASAITIADTTGAITWPGLTAQEPFIVNGSFQWRLYGTGMAVYHTGAASYQMTLEPNSYLALGVSNKLTWGSAGSSGSQDTGLGRDSAGVVRASNAGSGLGYLLSGVSVEVNTATKSAGITESGECYSNTGDADGSTINLPNDPTIGSRVCVLLTVSQTVTIVPAAGETISDAGTAYSTSCVADALGESIELVAATGGSGATWVPKSKVGTWTCS